MKKIRNITIILLLIFCLTGLEVFANADYVLTFGHVLQTDHAYHLMAEEFKKELEESSNGRVEVQIFPAGQLGNERDLVEGLQLGTVDISTITSALTASFVPEFKVFSLPFLFRDFEHMYAVMDSPIADQMAEDMKEKGLIKLGFVSGGSRSMYSLEPTRNLDELQGKKIRTMEDPIYLDTWNALGALATPIPWGDVYLSLDQGIVDGAEGALISYLSMGFYDPSPHITVINYIFSWHNFMMSEITWNKLPEDIQELVLEAAYKAQEFERQYVLELEEELLDILRDEHGATIYYPDDIEEWRAAVSDIYEKRADEVGGMDLIEAIIQTGL
jgi:TRAP-type transport system periplasmic protein